MPKVTINDSKGLLVEAGSGFYVASNPIASLQSQTAANTITPGVHLVSGTASAITLTLPLASAVPGGLFVVRSASVHAHILTGTDSGSECIVAPITGALGKQQTGSRLTFTSGVGNSVSLLSDGKNFLVTSQSGSFTYGGS